MFVYFVKPGGAVLASLKARDAEYEENLRDAGIKFGVASMPEAEAPAPAMLQRATIREGAVQIDREGTVH